MPVSPAPSTPSRAASPAPRPAASPAPATRAAPAAAPRTSSPPKPVLGGSPSATPATAGAARPAANATPALPPKPVVRAPVGGSTPQPSPNATPSAANGGHTPQRSPNDVPSEANGGHTPQPAPGTPLKADSPEGPSLSPTIEQKTKYEGERPRLDLKDGELTAPTSYEGETTRSAKYKDPPKEVERGAKLTEDEKKAEKARDDKLKESRKLATASTNDVVDLKGQAAKAEGETDIGGTKAKGEVQAMYGSINGGFSGSLTTDALDVHGKLKIDAGLLKGEGSLERTFPFEFPPGSGNKYDAKVTLTGKGNLGSINGDLDIGLRIGRDGKVDGTFKAEGFGGIKGELAAKVELLRDGKAVAALNAGAHGTLGAERSLEGKLGLKGGKFYAHGDVSGAFGVGGGAKFGVEADVIQAGLLAKDVAGHYGQAVNLPGAVAEYQHQAAIGAELDKQVRFNAGQVHGQEAANRVFGPNASGTQRLTGSLNTLLRADNFAALDPNRDGRVSRDDLYRAQDNASLPDNVRAAANTLSRTFPTVSSAQNGFNYFTQRDLDRVRQSMGLGTMNGTR